MRGFLRSLAPYGLSVVLHGAVGGGLAAGAYFVARRVIAPDPIPVELVVQPRPAVEETEEEVRDPRAAAAPRPPHEVRPTPRPRPRPRKVKMLTEIPSDRPPAPTPRTFAAAPQPERVSPVPVEGPVRPGPAAQPVYGVSLDSLGTGAGTFAVPAGNTLATNPSNRGPVEGPVGGPEVSALDGELQAEEDHRITSWPERIDAALFRYPEEARREGIEGSVLLRLEIDDRGRVRKAALVRGVNPVLDQAALANAPRLRFAPARAGQKPVPCEIRYTFTFVLD